MAEDEMTNAGRTPKNLAKAMAEIRTHPIQSRHKYDVSQARVPEVVALRAYEVYSKVCGPQPALIDLEGRNCRGGFGTGEIIAFLYARSFPEDEWDMRVREATRGMKNTG